METQVKQSEGMNYVIRYPNHYKEEEKYPVLIFLHGAGTRGTDIQKMLGNPFFQLTDSYADFPFVSIAPQCHKDTWFDLFTQLQEFVRKIVKEAYADPERIYLMGVSMGGYAAWQLAMSMPEVFAAMVPVCGGGMYWNAARLISVPIWAFHGAKDGVVFPEESKKMTDAVNRLGGSAKLTVYPDRMHDAWSDTYRNPEVFRWLLEHKKENPDKEENAPKEERFQDSAIYG